MAAIDRAAQRMEGIVAEKDYISLTDIARNRNTIEFLGLWESLNNPDFNPVEFDGFRRRAGLNSFTLTPKQWIEATGEA